MATPKVYVICDQNCKFESMTKEQILAAIAQAVETGTIGNIDTGFIQTIKTINGQYLRFFVGEQSAYDALAAADKQGLFAVITNDTTKEQLLESISNLTGELDGMKETLQDGSFTVKKAEIAEVASEAVFTSFSKTEFAVTTLTNEILREFIGGDGAKLLRGTFKYGNNESAFTDIIYNGGRGAVHFSKISETSYVAFALAIEGGYLKVYNAVIQSGTSLLDVAANLWSNTNISVGCTVTVSHKSIL